MNLNKNVLILISIAAVLILFLAAVLFLGQRKQELEQIAPREETLEEILQRLTPPETELLTREQTQEQQQLLRDLTPKETAPLTGQEQRELEELLQRLTPQP